MSKTVVVTPEHTMSQVQNAINRMVCRCRVGKVMLKSRPPLFIGVDYGVEVKWDNEVTRQRILDAMSRPYPDIVPMEHLC